MGTEFSWLLPGMILEGLPQPQAWLIQEAKDLVIKRGEIGWVMGAGLVMRLYSPADAGKADMLIERLMGGGPDVKEIVFDRWFAQAPDDFVARIIAEGVVALGSLRELLETALVHENDATRLDALNRLLFERDNLESVSILLFMTGRTFLNLKLISFDRMAARNLAVLRAIPGQETTTREFRRLYAVSWQTPYVAEQSPDYWWGDFVREDG